MSEGSTDVREQVSVASANDASKEPTAMDNSIKAKSSAIAEADKVVRLPNTHKEEMDTCRICRAEGSAEEPLFYPCKCSGSIKYVHQECLMEWLSHSQKKYCELCKTPFRFTKLYSPNMPRRLPTSVFIRKAVLHMLSHLATWLRGMLVGCVWLLCVPWTMRCIWRMMFWVADAGWARDSQIVAPLLMSSAASKSSPAGRDLATDQESSGLGFSIGPAISASILPVPGLVKTFFSSFAKSLAHLDGLENLNLKHNANASASPILSRMLEQSRSSILSDVRVLRALSSSSTVNRLIMDILEGQVITLSVVVVCILVFLIREWVVQQQPIADAAGAEAENALAQAGGGANDQNEIAEQAAGANNVDAVDVEDPRQVDDTNDEPSTGSLTATQRDLHSGPGLALDEILDRFQENFTQLDQARDLMKSLQADIDGSAEELHDPAHQRLVDLEKRISQLERDIIATIKTYGQTLQTLGNNSYNETDRKRLKDMMRRVEAVDTNAESSQDSASSFRATRPTMPARGRSSLATEIVRKIEEGDGGDGESDLPSVRGATVEEEEIEHGSSGSSSWEHLSNQQAADIDIEDARGHSSASHGSTSDHVGSTVVQSDGHVDIPNENDWADDANDAKSDLIHQQQNPFAPSPEDDIDDADLQTPEPQASSNVIGGTAEQTAGAQAGADFEVEQPAGLLVRIIDWFWGDIQPDLLLDVQDPEDEDDEEIVNELANEEPFVPFAEAEPIRGPHVANQADEDLADETPEIPVVEANDVAAAPEAVAEADALDPDALEDAEDLEGILELIGMQGPVAGLFQNAVFSSILISLSIALCVFIPYIWGKLVLLHIAEPSLVYTVPLKTATALADIAIDTAVATFGFFFMTLHRIAHTALSIAWSTDLGAWPSYQYATSFHATAKGALFRLAKNFVSAHDIQPGDFLYLSMACHAALHHIEHAIAEKASWTIGALANIGHNVRSAAPPTLARSFGGFTLGAVGLVGSTLKAIWSVVVTFYTTGSIPIPTGTYLHVPDDPMLTYWSAKDRLLAILVGYTAIGLICGLYVKIAPITSSRRARGIETTIIDVCQQAGGVLKVILIISIEMIAFPLFCGFLLDFALMPLFENATVGSRASFTANSPWTSGFVHWFVGTCYMFHFALFVSMCRGILRTGVLYFIRDPDDPTFHPVRDVLERNVITQLRKIAFSAIVYGALIIVCLGGIVWGLWAASDQVLPIHWSSTGSNIEFPLDILFYNFLTPFIVHYAKPSAGINIMYEWWFRKVARQLRLSMFLFQLAHVDEQGHWRRHTWKAWLLRRTDPALRFELEKPGRREQAEQEGGEITLGDADVSFVVDGCYVRAPASDQVRIPKGTPVFVPVDIDNKRLDGQSEDSGFHRANAAFFLKVYIPPWFKARIGLFVIAVWLFAAFTGICVTIIPLLFGRYILTSTLGPNEFINDIYAFSLGVYILGGTLYAIVYRRTISTWLRTHVLPSTSSSTRLLATLWSLTCHLTSLIYVYTFLALAMPLMNAALLEVYILMPMHYIASPAENHIMHLVQDWTLGILYVRIAMRLFLVNADGRPARAVGLIFANGYLHPDARRATRYFVLPCILAFTLAMGVPFGIAGLVNATGLLGESENVKVVRLVYPLCAGMVAGGWIAGKVVGAAGRWRMRIRDEVYLVGERLHNFGERRVGKGLVDKGKGKAVPADGVGA